MGKIKKYIFKRKGEASWDINRIYNQIVNDPSVLSDGNEGGIFFKPDGTVLYISAYSSYIHQFDLAVPWDISSISLRNSTTISLGNQGITFTPDGTYMFICGSLYDGIKRYNLTTPWDVTTYVFTSQKVLTAGINDIHFSPDGLHLYTADATDLKVYDYTLSSPYDITTATLTDEVSVLYGYGLFFKPDGSKMYVCTISQIVQYNLTTPFVVSSATLAYNTAASGAFRGIYCREDGKRVYTCSNNATFLQQWDWK